MSATDVLGATANAITEAAKSGQGMRVSCKGLSYGLTGYYSLAGQVNHVYVEGRSYSGLVVKDTATKVAVVDEGKPKPKAADTETKSVDIVKHAGYASVSLESLVFYDEAVRVVRDVLFRQALQSLDTALVTALAASSTALTTPGTSVSSKLIDGAAQLIAAGARSSVLALNPADYAALIGANSGGQYLNMNDPERGPSGLFLSHKLVPISAVPADTAYLIDPAAVVIAEEENSPYLFVSPMSTANLSEIILDLFAAPLVVLPGGVGKVALK